MTTDKSDAVAGLASLVPQVADEVVLQTVRDTHAAIADRVFAAVPLSQPVRVIHDRVAAIVYGTLGAVATGARSASGGVARAISEFGPAIPDTQGLRRSNAILNGVLGDLLEEQGNPLAIRMSVRLEGRDVPGGRAELATAYPSHSSRVVVFVHGLVEDEMSWAHKMAERGGTYPDTVADAGWTPVLVRYNSGRHISQNAADFSVLLGEVVANWPTAVTELVLVGHSMGGLVIRGAGELARRRDAGWPELVTDVVMLGTPHTGAALEKVANAGAWLMSKVPEAAPFGTILKRRSAGIKDLRHGYTTAEEWAGTDPDAWSSPKAAQMAGIGGAVHHNVAATLGATDQHISSRAFGDLLVHWGSGTGVGHDWARTATVTHLGSTDHFGLLNHPAVTDLLTGIVAD